MGNYFEDYVNRPKPNRAQRRKKAQERARQSRRATRAWQREKDGKNETKGEQ